MSPLSIRLEPEDRARLEELRQEISKRRRRVVSLSTVLRIVIGAGLKAQEAVFERARQAKIDAPQEPLRRWEQFVAPLAKATEEGRRNREQLRERFDRYCDARDITPVQFAQEMQQRGCPFPAKVLHEWYYRGPLPKDNDTAESLISEIEAWMASGRS